MNKLLSLLALLITTHVMSQSKSITPLKATKIAIFKNGTYYVAKEGAATSKSKVFYFTPPATALNGTFWYALKEGKIQAIQIMDAPTQVTKTANSFGEYLASNINTEVTLTLLYGTNTSTVKGIISNYYTDARMVVLKLNDGSLKLINVNSISDINLASNAKSSFVSDSIVRLAKVQLEKEISNSKFSTLCMQTGISWVPSYFIQLKDAKTATLDIKASIENTSENFTDVPVSLVVGNPQMYYGKQLDMMSSLIASNGGGNDNYTQKSIYSNMSGSYDGNAESASDNTTEVSGEKSNDLYYYNLGNMSLDKDAKVIVMLGSKEIEYKDLYELDIEDKANFWYTHVAGIDPNATYETWHVLKIENTTNTPLSTVPIFVTDENGKPLAQDELKYTPIGAKTKIKLSKAIDVQTCDDEEIVSKDANKVRLNKRDYETVKIKGKIKLVNYQAKQINIAISKTINGKITNGNAGTITILPNRNANYNNVNDINVVRWEKIIKPNETLFLDYEYEVLVYLN